MRIGFATSDWSVSYGSLGGSGTARIGLPSRFTSHEVVAVGGLIAHRDGELGIQDLATKEHHWGCDVIVMQRWMHDDLPDRVRRARVLGQVVLQDVDDWFWGLDPTNAAFNVTGRRRADGSIRPENREAYRSTCAVSDAVICSTPYLAKRLAAFGANTVVWRNAIDLQRWPQTLPEVRDRTVGWVGALSHRSGDIETLRGILGPLQRRLGFGVYHGGHQPGSGRTFWEAAGCDPVHTRALSMAAIDAYPGLFEPLGVGLVPLRDAPFNLAKSWIKGLEYAAAGVPFVAQATPEYQALQESYGIGLLARRPKDWARLIPQAIEQSQAEAGFNRVRVEALDIRLQIHRWDGIISALARARGVA